MQSNTFELIDLLVKMSGSKSNLDELKAELDDTYLKIDKIEKKLDSLDEEMSDDKYFDASSEIVDRNIKISLVKKIQKLNKVKAGIDKDLEQASDEERRLHDKLEELNQKLAKASEYTSVIKAEDSSSNAYNNMLSSETERESKLAKKKEETENEFEKIQKKVEYLLNASKEIVEKIEKENERLEEVENNLSNIKSYIDIETKEKDEAKYIDTKNELDKLIEHKEDIINDAVYIAGKVKEYVANNDQDKAKIEFNKLIDQIKKIPYMDLENDQIEVEMSKLDDELKNYDAEISSKEYQTMDKEFIEERIKYLEDFIKTRNEYIVSLNNRINELNNENELLSGKIYSSEEKISDIDDSLIDYESYDYESNELPKSVVQASNNKLNEEKENISNITDNYRSDLVQNIKEIKDLENSVNNLKSNISKKESELDELNKKLALNTTSTNILEEEKDKITLEKINTKITNLKNREKFNKSLSTIAKEFEMVNSSPDFIGDLEVEETPELPSGDTEVEVIDELPIEEETVIKEEVKEEPVENITSTNENVNVFETLEELSQEPTVKEEKLRVVEVTPINDSVKETKEEENYMVSDFQDDDYIDLDAAMNEVGENN